MQNESVYRVNPSSIPGSAQSLRQPFAILVSAAFLWLTANLSNAMVIGVIGDYGSSTTNEQHVADLIKSWNPDFIMTVGDNNYPDGLASTIDTNVGRFFHEYIYPYTGSYGAGASSNRFWPCIGNHDILYGGGPDPYVAYFTLPGNERYYTYRQGNVEIFCVNANSNEADGYTPGSIQGQWLQNQLAASTALWRLVFFHESPYTSGTGHGTYLHQTDYMMWPFKQWGATVVLSGHDHIYERISTNNLTYFVNGVGGDRLDTLHFPLTPGSQAQFTGDFGAMRIDATETNITFQFITWKGVVIDTYGIEAQPAHLQPLFSAGPFQIRLTGSPGQNYVTEASANLVDWTAISTNNPVNGSAEITDAQSGMFPSRFYRARIGH